MRVLFLKIIRLYWLLVPEEKRRKCIFEKSCSKHVYEETERKGFRRGIKQLIFRFKNCHPQFDIYTDFRTGKRKMILRTGAVVDDSQIAKRLK